MAQITGKTIYVLGAGASHHTGAPLLRDFLVTARLLREGRNELRYRDSFNRIFTWIDSLRASSYYVEFDLDNLEHVFSLAEMSRQLSLEAGEERSSDLRRIIMETLDRLALRYRQGQWQPDAVYHEFASLIDRLNDRRQQHTRGAHGVFEKEVIIAFNYDVMLDYAMRFVSAKPDYCLGEEGAKGGVKLLKLHGSTNWASCRNCKGHLQVVPATPIPAGHHIPGIPEEGHTLVFKMVTNVLTHTSCDSCHNTDTLEPVVIPPTWSKAVAGTPIAKIWATAVSEIRNAFQLVVIGYSMPPTDTFFQYLLTLGLESNPGFHRVVVVNRDKSDALRERYEGVFSRSLRDRGRLKFLANTFEEFVKEKMDTVGSIVEWPY